MNYSAFLRNAKFHFETEWHQLEEPATKLLKSNRDINHSELYVSFTSANQKRGRGNKCKQNSHMQNRKKKLIGLPFCSCM